MRTTSLLSCGLSLLALLAGGAGGCSSNSSSVGANRVHLENVALSILTANGSPSTQPDASTDASTSSSFQANGSFVYVAAVDAPVDTATGGTVQATNFAFDSRYAYVVYNTAGATVGGALDVIDMAVVGSPVLVSSTVFTTIEFADIQLSGTTAYLVGQRSDGAGAGAFAVVDVSNPAAPNLVSTLDLQGYYATSIAVDGPNAYVTTGTNGGLAILDISSPLAPNLTSFTTLTDALDVVRDSGHTYVLGGSPTTLYSALDGTSLSAYPSPLSSTALSAPSRLSIWNEELFTNAGSTFVASLVPGQNPVVTLASPAGTSNGIDVAQGWAVLAQGEDGTSLYDVSTLGQATGSATALGSFAFPDDRGSSNEVRYGATNSGQYIFLSDGLGGFRIIQFTGVRAAVDGGVEGGSNIRSDAGTDANVVANADANGDGGSLTCNPDWWEETAGDAWWSSPGAPSDAPATATTPVPGAWYQVTAETTALCIVEEFAPPASGCTSILKRARAIGPKPNEGQECPISCPQGTVIADAHTRYGEASPANASGDYSCTGTTEPDSHEIECDSMSDFCNTKGQSVCETTYDNAYCGDPWGYCIKTGRTRWNCVPDTTAQP